MTDDTEDVRDLLGAYVLGTCTPEEAARVQAQLESSPDLQRELEALMPVRRVLLNAAAPVENGPDAALKRSLMAQVRTEASVAPVSKVRARRVGFWAGLRSPVRVGALAAVLVAIVVAVTVFTGGGDTVEKTYDAQVTRTLAPRGAAQIAVGEAEAQLTVTGLPAPGSGRRYQVWLQTGTQAPRPTRVLFDVDASGHAKATIPALDGVDHVLVTSEPAAGSPAPTRPPILQAAV